MTKKKKKIFITLIVCIIFLFILFKFDNKKVVNDILDLNKVSIYDKDNNVIYESVNNQTSSYVKFEDISSKFIELVVNVEDKNFYKHYGFDVYRIPKVFVNNIIRKQKHGASTISQQYIKNLYLNNAKTYSRKLKEIYYAYRLEKLYTKDEILKGYLNTIYFSNNLYGLKDACHFYFNKSPNSININEMALLMALIKAPNNYDPVNNYEKAMLRKDEYLKTFYKKQLITRDEYEIYYNNDITIQKNHFQLYSSPVMFFKDLVLNEFNLLNIKKKFNCHYKIYTNYEVSVNNKIQEYIDNYKPRGDVSCVILDNNGYYVSLIGGKNYYDYSYNTAIYGNRDIGSTIKPLLYYKAIEDGFTPTTTFYSGKKTFKINNIPYEVSNYNEIYENKDITLGYALATSDNIYAVKTHLYLGMDKLVGLLDKFDIKASIAPTVALGNASTSLSKLTSIYLTLANLGVYKKSHAIKEVTCNEVNVYEHNMVGFKKLDASKTFVLNNLMTLMFDENISKSVTGSSINQTLKLKTAGKSGLTDYDSYMIGFNNDYCVGLWTGHINNTLLTDFNLKILSKKLYSVAFNNLSIREDLSYKIPSNVTFKDVNINLSNKSYKRQTAYLK